MNGALFHSILLGPAALSPHVAARLVAATESVPDLRLTLGVLSSSFNDDVEESFRARFQDSYLAFHGIDAGQAPQRAEALQIVRTQLVPLIETVPDASWQSIVRRFGKTEQAIAYLNAQTRERWMPRFMIQGESLALQKRVKFLLPKMLRGLLPVSVWAEVDAGDWSDGLFESGLLEAELIQFKVRELRATSKVGLKVQWSRSDMGSPIINIACRMDSPLRASDLAYAIIRSCKHKKKHEVSLKADDLLHPEGRSAYVRYSQEYFATMMAGRFEDPAVHVAAAIQKMLLAGEGREEIRRVFQSIQIPELMQNRLIAGLDALQLRVRLAPCTWRPDKSYPVGITFRPGDHSLPEQDQRRTDTLFLNFHLPRDFLGAASAEDFWRLVARGYARWDYNGGTRVNSTLRINLGQTGSQELSHSIELHKNLTPFLPDPKVPTELAQEYVRVWQWLSALQGGAIQRHFPGLAELRPRLKASELVDLKRFHFPLDSLRWIDRSEETAPATITIPTSKRRWKARFEGDLERFVSMSPLALLEIAACALRNVDDLDVYFDVAAKAIPLQDARRSDVNSVDTWTWLRLFWRYERLLASPPESAGFQLLGEKLPVFGKQMAWALRKQHLSETAMVIMSLSNHTVWIADFSEVDISVSSRNYEKKARPASQLSILTVARAKLLHFDGQPADWDRKTWLEIVRVILRAQDGLTWLRIGGNAKRRTNRPEVLAEEGSDAWYRLNPHYLKAPDFERTQYREAMNTLIELARQSDTPLPTPRFTAEELKSTYRALVLVYHPDMQEDDDTTGKTFQDLQAAYNFLKEFHP